MLGRNVFVNLLDVIEVGSIRFAIRALGDALQEISIGIVPVGDGKYLHASDVFAARQAAKHFVLAAGTGSVLAVREEHNAVQTPFAISPVFSTVTKG